jgi:hypothetical protein
MSMGPINPEWEAAFWGRLDEFNPESGPIVVPHLESSTIGADLVALAYSASSHQIVVRDRSMAIACARPEVTTRTRLALFACDLTSPDITEDDVGEVLQSQAPSTTNICHPFRTRETEGLANAVAELIPICLRTAGVTPLDRMQLADAQDPEGGEYWKRLRNQ